MQVLQEDQNVMMSQWLEQLKLEQRQIIFLSQDIAIHQQDIVAKLAGQAIISPTIDHLPRPGKLALLSEHYPQTANVHSLTPNYIRMVEAEANWLKEQRQHGSH